MSQPQRKHDAYGRPLPTVVHTPPVSLKNEPSNAALRQELLGLLCAQWETLLQRGIHAEVTVTVHIHDGRLQRDMQVQVNRQYRVD